MTSLSLLQNVFESYVTTRKNIYAKGKIYITVQTIKLNCLKNPLHRILIRLSLVTVHGGFLNITLVIISTVHYFITADFENWDNHFLIIFKKLFTFLYFPNFSQ